MEVLARVPGGRLDKAPYDRMLENDPALIWPLALNRPLHGRCSAKLSPDALKYGIEWEKPPPGSLKGPVELIIVRKVSPGIGLSKLTREITGLSARDFAMMSSGLISSPDAKDLMKARMGTRCTARLLPG